ncbi:MAG: hypothetical protein Dasosvirus2_31 [Dasosvirus sp.]|uniref:Uncharacterized protein n=1 Tax=Dasosvirus sp. TaxID=2487764 RepID=A0A3G4ZRE1_9VIRU|nr:MAG: hypothetical protein Dasosvirus2_31 [Dasosvirus sp.]
MKKYQRSKYFIDQIQKYQGTTIPEKVLNVIKEEIKQKGLASDMITVSFVRETLKKHHLIEFYEECPSIYCKLTGNSPPTLEHNEYKKLKQTIETINLSNNNQ